MVKLIFVSILLFHIYIIYIILFLINAANEKLSSLYKTVGFPMTPCSFNGEIKHCRRYFKKDLYLVYLSCENGTTWVHRDKEKLSQSFLRRHLTQCTYSMVHKNLPNVCLKYKFRMKIVSYFLCSISMFSYFFLAHYLLTIVEKRFFMRYPISIYHELYQLSLENGLNQLIVTLYILYIYPSVHS